MNRRKIALFFVIAAVSTMIALPAAAYSHFDNCNGHWTRWQNSYKTLNVSTSTGQFPTADWQNSLEAARQAWNYAPGVAFHFNYNWTSAQVSGYSGDSSDDIAIVRNWPYATEIKAYTKHKRSDCDNWNWFDEPLEDLRGFGERRPGQVVVAALVVHDAEGDQHMARGEGVPWTTTPKSTCSSTRR
jgi:hypothetical protein